MGKPNRIARIYLETTALVQLGPAFETVDLEKLLALRESAHFGVYISEVSWLEYLRKRKKDLRFLVDAFPKADVVLKKHGKLIPEISQGVEKITEYLRDIDRHYRDKAGRKGIEIVPLHPVSTDRLLRMSIECIPPFEEAEDESKEKGFRDSLIMFSILHSLGENCSEPVIIVTQDKLLTAAFNLHASEYNIKLTVVTTIDQAAAYIASRIAESERKRIRGESLKAIQLLSRYEKNIVESIAEIREVTDQDIGQGLRWDLMPPAEQGLDITRVRSLEFEKIDSAIWKDQENPLSRILFRCLCKLSVLVRSPDNTGGLLEARRFKIGESIRLMSSNSIVLTGGIPFYEPPTEERAFPFDLYGVAEFRRAEVGREWQLLKITVEKSLPGKEDFHALATAVISEQAGGGDGN